MFTAEQRRKEIGVRKVLGASIRSIFALLSKEFFVLVVIAVLIVLPLSWSIMSSWLQNFAYQTTLGWEVFALTTLLIVIIYNIDSKL
jgi:putative ABC transport system permease protein